MKTTTSRIFGITLAGVLALIVTSAHADTFGTGGNVFTMDFVTIGNPGNANDDTGYGGVADTFRMGTYEVSRDMITHANVAGNLGITLFDMTSYGGNGANRPVTSATWNEAARFVNWLNVTSGSVAAYNFSTQPGEGGYDAHENIVLWDQDSAGSGYNAANPFRNSNATYFLPSENEWYKSAYYSGAGSIYYDYPTGSDGRPTSVASGTSSGTTVYNNQSSPADITLAGGLSPYGTMGQGGNVWEWMETEWDGTNDNSVGQRVLRGGSYSDDFTSGSFFQTAAFRCPAIFSYEPEYNGGFRVASVAGPVIITQVVEDGFNGTVGAAPDASKFIWSGEVVQTGDGKLYFNTEVANNSWLRSIAGAAPGLGETLVLKMRARAYAETWNPGIYGDAQPRGLRVGSDANNVVEFYSLSNSSVGMRLRKAGVESLASYALSSSVWDLMHDYEIAVSPTAVTFKVDGAVAGTFTTNIPTGVLNVYVHTYNGGFGQVPISIDNLSLTLATPFTKIIGLSGNLAFGDVTIGQTATATMTVANSGNSALTVTGITYPDGFSGEWSGTIAAGASQDVTVTFSPLAVTTYSGTVTVNSDMTSGGNTLSASGTALSPQLEVEQPESTVVASDDSRDFGNCIVGAPKTLAFTVRNAGPGALTGIAITFTGPAATDFSLVAAMASQIAAGDSATFDLRFAPATGGTKSAVMHLASNDPDHNPFDIQLTGFAFSTADDTDMDGMNDAAEYQLAALGFDWQVPQPSLVATYFANANLNHLYTQDQVQALHVSAPLLAKDPLSGLFKLTIGVKKSADLLHFNPLPMTAPQATLNADGELEFLFSSPDNAAFFRLEAD